MKISDVIKMEDIISDYESELSGALSAVAAIKDNLRILHGRMSNLTIVENSSFTDTENHSSLTGQNTDPNSSESRNNESDETIDPPQTAVSSTAEESTQNESSPGDKRAGDGSIDEENDRLHWKTITPEMLKRNGNMSTRQFLVALDQEGIIDRTNKKHENRVRAGLKSLEAAGIIKRVEPRYGAEWTLIAQ
jgi:hypothetical protein